MRNTPAATAAERAYAMLRREVETALKEGRLVAEAATIEWCWRVGRLIHEHVLEHQERADYGARTLRRLAGDIRISDRALYRCWLLGRAYEISPSAAKLTCAHYFALSRVEDLQQRRALTAQAEQRGWVAKELERRVTAVLETTNDGNGDASSAQTAPATSRPRLLQPKRGRVGLYQIVSRASGLAIDAGFKFYPPLTPAQARHRTAAEIVRYSADEGLAAAPDAGSADLFTYTAVIVRVIDGDTFAATVELPHGEMDEKLRLRGVDCPEIPTAAGEAAKRHVQALVSAAAEIEITTSKVDKYDRYLADVHLRFDGAALEKILSPALDDAGWLHLNNALLAEGYAERTDNNAAADFVP